MGKLYFGIASFIYIYSLDLVTNGNRGYLLMTMIQNEKKKSSSFLAWPAQQFVCGYLIFLGYASDGSTAILIIKQSKLQRTLGSVYGCSTVPH